MIHVSINNSKNEVSAILLEISWMIIFFDHELK